MKVNRFGKNKIKSQAIWNISKRPGLGKGISEINSRFTAKIGEIDGATGHIHDLVRIGLMEGLGKAERIATARHDSIDKAAASWAGY